jgi:aspartate/methionine/tyrosine aminotransferase
MMTLSHVTAMPTSPPPIDPDAEATVRRMRAAMVEKYRPLVAAAPAPIRIQARMVNDVISAARQAGVPDAVIARGVVNRTIGDVNVRRITEVVNGVDYSTIGEDLGLILPGEVINGRVSEGRTYLDLRERMMRFERILLEEYHWDLRIYDIYAVGNPFVRQRLEGRFQREYGIALPWEQTYVTIGALDAMDKSLRTLNLYFREKYGEPVGFAFPAPGFAVCLWQAESVGMEIINFQTPEAGHFKLTAPALRRLLAEHPNLHVLYLTVSSNPTAFAYSPAELRALYRVLRESGREVAVLADLAYIGTGVPADDQVRMAALNEPDALNRTIFINSLSKVYTLTGDRMGWAATVNPDWAAVLPAAWNNANAGMPAEWQLRYLANIDLFDERPWIQEKITALYALRRKALRHELEAYNRQFGLFEQIGLDDDTTIYNWSKLAPGEDAFSLFEKTGIAGVDGRAFGYSDRYIRFSVGFTPVPPDQLATLNTP